MSRSGRRASKSGSDASSSETVADSSKNNLFVAVGESAISLTTMQKAKAKIECVRAFTTPRCLQLSLSKYMVVRDCR